MEMISKVHRYLRNQYLVRLNGHDKAARDELVCNICINECEYFTRGYKHEGTMKITMAQPE